MAPELVSVSRIGRADQGDKKAGTLRGDGRTVKGIGASGRGSLRIVRREARNNNHVVRRLLPLFLVLTTCLLLITCVREKEAPDSHSTAPPYARALTEKPKPIAEYDVAGKKRTMPRTTMGALEADPASPRAPPRKPAKPVDPKRAK